MRGNPLRNEVVDAGEIAAAGQFDALSTGDHANNPYALIVSHEVIDALHFVPGDGLARSQRAPPPATPASETTEGGVVVIPMKMRPVRTPGKKRDRKSVV